MARSRKYLPRSCLSSNWAGDNEHFIQVSIVKHSHPKLAKSPLQQQAEASAQATICKCKEDLQLKEGHTCISFAPSQQPAMQLRC